MSGSRTALLALPAAALIAAVVVIAGSGGNGEKADAAKVDVDTATALVARRNLTQSANVDGILGYADPRPVDGQLSGVVTNLPREGQVVHPGHTLFGLDHQRILLLSGRLPAWRALRPGVTDGPDVRQLERNLVTLGYATGAELTADDHWTAATTTAVKRLQRHVGLSRTGGLELGRVVFLRGARRIASTQARLGQRAAPGQPVLSTTSTRRRVAIKLPVEDAQAAHRGDSATVILPDGTQATGRIASVGKVAHAAAGQDGGATLDVSITLHRVRNLTRLDQAPVSVSIARERRRHALSVPLNALVGRPGGGFAVEVISGGSRRLVAVRPGLFADGYVEVDGVTEGTPIAVPR